MKSYDGGGDPRGKLRRERGHVPFQPAQGAGYDHFVKVYSLVRGRGDGDRVSLPALDVRLDGRDLRREFEFGFSQCLFGDEVED